MPLPEKALTVPLVTVTSPVAKPVTGSLKVAVTLGPALLVVPGPRSRATVGAVAS